MTTKSKDHVKSFVRAKFGSYRYFGKGIITFLICNMISRDYVLRESCDFMGGSPLPYGAALPSLIAIDLEKEDIFSF